MYQDCATIRPTNNSLSDPMKIVLMMYDGCIGYINKAIDYADSGDTENKCLYTNKAGDIIVELNDALDLEAGGEIATNLRSLYVYMGRNLMDASTNNSTRGLKEVARLMSNMKQGWNHVAFNTQDEYIDPIPQMTA